MRCSMREAICGGRLLLALGVCMLISRIQSANIEICTSAFTGSISGDPHFYGFNGQKYEFQGEGSGTYNLLTFEEIQLNGRFTMNEKWGNDHTFIDAIGLQSGSDSRASVTCKGNLLEVALNGAIIPANEVEVDEYVSVYKASRRTATIATPWLDVQVSFAKNAWSNCFLNLDFTVHKQTNLDLFHGLLGQTVQVEDADITVEDGSSMGKFSDGVFSVEGTGDDYKIASGDLFGNSFAYNLFHSKGPLPVSVNRRLLNTSACEICYPNPCEGHPNNMENCMIKDGSMECFGTTTDVSCPPSGCTTTLSGGGAQAAIPEHWITVNDTSVPCTPVSGTECESFNQGGSSQVVCTQSLFYPDEYVCSCPHGDYIYNATTDECVYSLPTLENGGFESPGGVASYELLVNETGLDPWYGFEELHYIQVGNSSWDVTGLEGSYFVGLPNGASHNVLTMIHDLPVLNFTREWRVRFYYAQAAGGNCTIRGSIRDAGVQIVSTGHRAPTQQWTFASVRFTPSSTDVKLYLDCKCQYMLPENQCFFDNIDLVPTAYTPAI